MEQIVVKTEVQNNGEILLYYVDENGESQQGIVTTLENIEQSDIENAGIQIHDNNFILNHHQIEDYVSEPLPEVEEEAASAWSDDEMKRLLLFYSDNKSSFLVSGSSQRHHLWSVACKTMLIGKDPDSCEAQLNELKAKYDEVLAYTERGVIVKWELLELCQQAFAESKFNEQLKLKAIKQEFSNTNTKKIALLKQDVKPPVTNVVKQISTRTADENVEQMLKLYLKYKLKFQKEHWNKDLWSNIALELGSPDDGPIWHKRFLNFKQHYVNLLYRQHEDSSVQMNWPYLELFDKIYQDDVEFQRKYCNNTTETVVPSSSYQAVMENEWNTSHITILGKYYYDSYNEFEDPTIPNMFLWTEVGRIIEKKPMSCKEKYASLRAEHINSYIAGGYSLQNRNAIAIILDNIIAKDVKRDFNLSSESGVWKRGNIDELVKFFYDNLEAFKEPICHFVCWEAIATKLNHNIKSCKNQWDELVALYKTLMEEKRNDSELQIDWRYIDMFDHIFNYGMDMNFMVSFYTGSMPNNENDGKLTVKKVTIREDDEPKQKKSFHEAKTSSTPRTDPRSTKILEFFHRNKDNIQSFPDKLELWEPLSKEIDMNTTQCAHRFRHLKKTYLDTVQKEIKNPKSTITWPYYNLCKKVFGYRVVKSQMKINMSTEDDWLVKEIKQLITYFSKHFYEINNNEDISVWEPLARVLNKTPFHCKEKFVELRKCYRKLKTMKTRNPDLKISWAHFPMFDQIYTENAEEEPMEVEALEEEHLEDEEIAVESLDDDYQCIIVLQEGQDLSDIANAQIILPDQVVPEHTQEIEMAPQQDPERLSKLWTKRSKKLLLIHYINYMRSHRGKKIIQKQLWENIAGKMPHKTNVQCKNMFRKIRKAYANADEDKRKATPLNSLMEKVLKLEPNFSITPVKDAKIHKTYKDVDMDPLKIDSALTYYLNHIDDFVDPKFEKTYLWTELANYISEPVAKVYNKINYLKQAYNVETEEIDGKKTPWSGILNEIIVKEVSTNAFLDETKPIFDDDINWSTELTERLLTWYLSNLDKFKNPKFNRSYLWIEASAILNKSPVVCSKKMSEVRTQYRNIVKNNAGDFDNWCFFELCQKIYGTGKKPN